MRSTHLFNGTEMMERKAPSLVELCIQTAIDNVRYIGDVGETDIYLLKDVLPHCTVDQLMHIENSTVGRDLSPVTDNLWKKFYEKQFGTKSTDIVIERMKQKKLSFKWKQLYEAKQKDWDEAQKKSIDRFKERYEKETVKKQSKQIQICTKVPPSSSKRSFFGGPGSCNGAKGSLMKKARMEFLNSHEVRAAAMKKALQRNQGTSHMVKPSGFHGKGSSSSRTMKPFQRRS
ncbi:uncharacterized protein LOC122069681 [Macadamia integrifolia]|uniref:uncharacterized protein LOC122069681 n=1 Tax=Macadamia integrifolia TaxID=60698 RepID=UPI001C4E39E1|nr:uncharacterized protein LOC122069681 [Macadamia integrifolia]XP_042489681.1 uncharacterized protein LOC122069681 [Macadamia integrifolia]